MTLLNQNIKNLKIKIKWHNLNVKMMAELQNL